MGRPVLIDSRSVGCKMAYLEAHRHRDAIMLSTSPPPTSGSQKDTCAPDQSYSTA